MTSTQFTNSEAVLRTVLMSKRLIEIWCLTFNEGLKKATIARAADHGSGTQRF